jgi:polysaccharide biosynthesis protein PslA
MRSRIRTGVSMFDSAHTPADVEISVERIAPIGGSHRTALRIPFGSVAAVLDFIACLGLGGWSVLRSANNTLTADRTAIITILSGSLLLLNLLYLNGAYQKPNGIRRNLLKSVVAWLEFSGVFVGLTFIDQKSDPPTVTWPYVWMFATLFFLILIRIAIRLADRSAVVRAMVRENWAVIGTGAAVQGLLVDIRNDCPGDVDIAGVYTDVDAARTQSCVGYTVRTLDQFEADMKVSRIDRVVLAFPGSDHWRIRRILVRFQHLAIDVWLYAGDFGLQSLGWSSPMGRPPLIPLLQKPVRGWKSFAKRAEDCLLAALIICLAMPLMLVIAVLIRIDSSGPILFKQKRFGFNGELTSIGRFLRRSSIDELPQLLNVLLGNMSIVGPRPHALASKAGGVLFQDAVKHYAARHRVKPGITGWAQVNGWRGETGTIGHIQRRVECDMYYIRNWSVGFDLRIIFLTAFRIFTDKSAY